MSERTYGSDNGAVTAYGDGVMDEVARRLHIPAPVVTRETRLMGGVVAAIAWLEQDRDMRNGSPAWHALAELKGAMADCRRLP